MTDATAERLAWNRAQILKLAGWINAKPHRWPAERIVRALGLIETGYERWPEALAEHDVQPVPQVARRRGRPPGSIDRGGKAVRVDGSALRHEAWPAFCRAFGQRLKALREEQNIAAAELAAAISVSPQTVMAWERGRSIPGIPWLLMISAALRCSLVALMPDEAHHQSFPKRS